ncbi:GNAT family N-acetyltransferase [Tunicatimonas pelagia]|uniref:GNAT family N-acetyltransferase n=1 Tax=Tunicatimonas pelagia TaxID=931531 RepID=UPI002666C186|nr:GNAT family N-acetyltransferase [Tunicatimonas pelagia]WKN42422.1 GNAT family N-acetyltransferase [Tunicatimonas pelagia]
MIVELKERHISDVAYAQMLAWQKAFEGILSEELLVRLQAEDFESNWKKIIQQTERKNLVWLNEEDAVGFVSFGEPKDEKESADFEIYGIYVHPNYWNRKVGFELMKAAIDRIQQYSPESTVVLWVMKENLRSRKFYERFGFSSNGLNRTSTRNSEAFEEVKYSLTF